MQLTLTTGEKITIKERFTHKMHRELFKSLNRGVVWKQNIDTGEYEKELPAENIELQYESVFPLMIEGVAVTPEWMDELLQEDYRAIEEAIAKVRTGLVVKTDEGEKKGA